MARKNRRFTWRLMLLMLVLVLSTGGIVVRLVQVQIIDHEYYVLQAEEEHLHKTVVRAPRGAILDRNGFPLVTTVAAFDVYVDPRSWSDVAVARRSADMLGPLLGRSADELIAEALQFDAGDYLAARGVSGQVGLQLFELAPTGVRLVETSKRSYPEGDLASVLLGFIGRDQVGLSGIEAAFDRELGGVPAEIYFERDALGNPIPFGQSFGEEPIPGGDVHLTIDRHLQRLVEQKLKFEVERHGAKGGTILIMNPHTGEVLAMASQPGFRLSGLDLDNEEQADLYRPRAVTDVYPPGSVMKTITMATAIDLGLVTPGTTYLDDGIAEVEGGEPIRNWDFSAHGITTMTELLQFSLNTGAVWLARLIGANQFYNYIEKVGFQDTTRIGLGGEPEGIVRTYEDDDWYPIDLATNSFGQGISVTPLHMITAVAALVNGGLLMQPYIVKEVADKDGLRTYDPVVVRRFVSEETSRTMVQMMNAVVDGMPTHGAQVAGLSVGGKTGTTTFVNSAETIASFVGFAPVDDPQFIMLVKINSPQTSSLGGVVAAPIFKDLAPQVYAYLSTQAGNPAFVEREP